MKTISKYEAYAIKALRTMGVREDLAGFDYTVEADKAGLVEWKEVPREEEPALYKMVDGIPGVEDAVLMRGTLRVLRKERG